MRIRRAGIVCIKRYVNVGRALLAGVAEVWALQRAKRRDHRLGLLREAAATKLK